MEVWQRCTRFKINEASLYLTFCPILDARTYFSPFVTGENCNWTLERSGSPISFPAADPVTSGACPLAPFLFVSFETKNKVWPFHENIHYIDEFKWRWQHTSPMDIRSTLVTWHWIQHKGIQLRMVRCNLRSCQQVTTTCQIKCWILNFVENGIIRCSFVYWFQ